MNVLPTDVANNVHFLWLQLDAYGPGQHEFVTHGEWAAAAETDPETWYRDTLHAWRNWQGRGYLVNRYLQMWLSETGDVTPEADVALIREWFTPVPGQVAG